MQQKLITFAVPCYNSAAYMRHCIETLLSAGEQAEIILVDDGSVKDETPAICDEYAAKYTRSYNFSLNTYAELPLGFMVKSDAAYSFRNGTNIKKGEDDQVVWNLGASWRFLKKKQAELSLYWSDILSDKKNYYHKTQIGTKITERFFHHVITVFTNDNTTLTSFEILCHKNICQDWYFCQFFNIIASLNTVS